MNETTSLAPFPTVTPTDHRLWLWITIVVCMVVSVLSMCFRLCMRFRRYGLDDLAIMICFVFVMTQASVLIAALNLGFGVALTPGTKPGIVQAAKLVFAARPLLSSALCASKASAILLLRRLVARRSWRTWTCDAALCLMITWAIAAILTTTLDCSPSNSTSQSIDEGCPGIEVRMTTTMALNMATEIGIFGLAIICFKSFDMETKHRYNVLASYSLRIVIIALSIAYLTTHISTLHTPATPTSLITPTILSLALSTTSLLAPLCTSIFPYPLPTSPSSAIEMQKHPRPRLRRLSTPMSFWTDRLRGDREVFKHKARVFVGGKEELGNGGSGGARDSMEGIFREETFVITTKRFSEGTSTVLDV